MRTFEWFLWQMHYIQAYWKLMEWFLGNKFIYLYAIFQQATQFSVGWFKWGPANNLQDIHFKTLHHIT